MDTADWAEQNRGEKVKISKWLTLSCRTILTVALNMRAVLQNKTWHWETPHAWFRVLVFALIFGIVTPSKRLQNRWCQVKLWYSRLWTLFNVQSGLDTLTRLLGELTETESQRSLLDVAKQQIFSNSTDNLSDKKDDEERPFTESYHKYKEDYVKCLTSTWMTKTLVRTTCTTKYSVNDAIDWHIVHLRFRSSTSLIFSFARANATGGSVCLFWHSNLRRNREGWKGDTKLVSRSVMPIKN